MAMFSGTQQKCKVCDKVVHFIETLTADGVPYHKSCFKCSQCNGVLAMSTYSSMNGVLFCKPHFAQHLKETGNVPKKAEKSGSQNEQPKTLNKLSSFFSGTQDKCRTCNKTVYPLEKVTVEGEFYHKLCFRCARGGCKLSPSSYASLDGFLYCKPHFAQLFKEKGSYNHLTRTASRKIESPPPEELEEEEGAQTNQN